MNTPTGPNIPTGTYEVVVAPVTQQRVLVSEWIKMRSHRSHRSTMLTLLAAVLAMIALAWIVGWASNARGGRLCPSSPPLVSA